MDIMMPLLMILTIFHGCIGMDPQDIEWTPELKQELIKVLHRTFLFTSGHSERLLDIWNRENPSHKFSNHEALYKLALSLIENKNIKGKYPESTTKPLLLKWPREMKTDLFYIHYKLRKEGETMAKKMRAKWKLLYPYHRIKSETLESYSRYLHEAKFRPTENELKMAEEKYHRVNTVNEKRREILIERSHQGELDKQRVIWTPKLKTDLLYIVNQIEANKLPLHPYLKVRWDKLNKEYSFLSQTALIASLNRLEFNEFTPIPEDMENTRARYEILFPIDYQSPNHKNKTSATDGRSIASTNLNPHKQKFPQHYPSHPTLTLEHHGSSSSNTVDHTYHQSINGSDTAGATSIYYSGDHGPQDKITSPSQFHQYELHQQHLDDPIYSPSDHGDFPYPSVHNIYHLEFPFEPYTYDLPHDPGEGSSSQSPGSSRGQHPPQP